MSKYVVGDLIIVRVRDSDLLDQYIGVLKDHGGDIATVPHRSLRNACR